MLYYLIHYYIIITYNGHNIYPDNTFGIVFRLVYRIILIYASCRVWSIGFVLGNAYIIQIIENNIRWTNYINNKYTIHIASKVMGRARI